jgi:hypothetical protein
MTEAEQIQQLEAQLQQKQNEIAANMDQIRSLGAYQAEALNGRDTIAGLQEKVDVLDKQLDQAKRDTAQAVNQGATSAAKSGASQKKVAAAEDLAKAIKVFLGS